MTQTIFLNVSGGQYVVIPRIVSVNNTTGDQSQVTGSTNGELLSSQFTSISLYLYQNVSNTETTLSQDIVWSENLGVWKTLIPSTSVTSEGPAYLSLYGSNTTLSIVPLVVELNISHHFEYLLDAVIDQDTHAVPKSLARLLYILYCGEIGNITNTNTTRTIKDESGSTIVSNTLTSSETTVTRSGGHE